MNTAIKAIQRHFNEASKEESKLIDIMTSGKSSVMAWEMVTPQDKKVIEREHKIKISLAYADYGDNAVGSLTKGKFFTIEEGDIKIHKSVESALGTFNF